LQLLFAEAGILSVYIVSLYGNVNQILVCSGTSLIVSLVFPKYSTFFLSAALGGIMLHSSIENIGFVFVVGFFVMLINNLAANIFVNVGGKPGTIAFISNFLTLCIVYFIGLSKVYDFEILPVLWDPRQYAALNVWIYVFGPFFGSISCLGVHLVGYFREVVEQNTSRVFSYGTMTLFVSFYLQIFSYQYMTYTRGTQFVTVSYGAYFLGFCHAGTLGGISLKYKFSDYLKEYNFHHYIIVGYIAGWVLLGMSGILMMGGKHGFSGFSGNIIYIYSVKLIECLFCKKEKIDSNRVDVKSEENEKIKSSVKTASD
jgi:hypothetical protein